MGAPWGEHLLSSRERRRLEHERNVEAMRDSTSFDCYNCGKSVGPRHYVKHPMGVSYHCPHCGYSGRYTPE